MKIIDPYALLFLLHDTQISDIGSMNVAIYIKSNVICIFLTAYMLRSDRENESTLIRGSRGVIRVHS